MKKRKPPKPPRTKDPKGGPAAVPTFTVELRPAPDPTDPRGVRRLRRLLKFALRVCGLRCVGCKESKETK